ncbi:gas vesicle protein GvpO, halophile-type [Halomarina oriensis]|uniref:Gas vesicle protein n=1 Tax=Halomarina oriensis TaxID=671145 RepID=A0A6B0GV72_9EURY|nr:gas vesicle protein GvpO [Halomarina oriensis]MWG36015.1 gas vesicle protein [Halomarina oriensis]
MSESDADQCRALTADGERCGNAAGEDGFCHQHDESDSTVDDAEGSSTDEESSTEDDVSSESESTDGGDGVGLIEVRDTVRSNAGQLIGHPFDALVEVGRRRDDAGDPDGWVAVVEVVERKAIPDTQDILGRYEIDLNAQAEFQAYRRVQRLHRGDTGDTEV